MAASEKTKTENPMSVVKEHITNRNFSRIYLFCGSEQYLARQSMNSWWMPSFRTGLNP